MKSITKIFTSSVGFALITVILCFSLFALTEWNFFIWLMISIVGLIILSAFYNTFKERKSINREHVYIPKGERRPRGLNKYIFKPLIGKMHSTYEYSFDFIPFEYEDKKLMHYENKLYGFSLTLWPRIKKYNNQYVTNWLSPIFKYLGYSFILPHHWFSFRISWRYIKESDEIVLSRYEYKKGLREVTPIIKIRRHDSYRIGYKATGKHIIFKTKNQFKIVEDKTHRFGYKLRPYCLNEKSLPVNVIILCFKIKN